MLNRRKKVKHIVATILLTALSPLFFARAASAADPVYDCGDYGADSYSENCVTGETIQGDGGGSSGGGILSGSGQRIALYSSLSLICISGAIYLLIRAKKSSTEPSKSSIDSIQS
jgi:hypothetical protein